MKIELPDGIGITNAIIDDKIVFVSIEQDCYVENPLEDSDCYGDIYSFSTNHRNCWKSNSDTLAELAEEIGEEFNKDFVFLGYFEHGRCDWHVSGRIPRGAEGDYRWDGVAIAGFWVPNNGLLGDLELHPGPAREKRKVELASQACKAYTSWCNGDVYGYDVSVYDVKFGTSMQVYDDYQDYRHEDTVFEDSCYGYYDYKYLAEQIKDALEAANDHLSEKITIEV